jgi:hypothetical protein
MIAHHFPLPGLFVFSAFHRTTFPPRLETTLNYATPRDQAECVVALSASGWNSFTMNNFAVASLLLHRYCPDGETRRSVACSCVQIFTFFCVAVVSLGTQCLQRHNHFPLVVSKGQVGSSNAQVRRRDVVSPCW